MSSIPHACSNAECAWLKLDKTMAFLNRRPRSGAGGEPLFDGRCGLLALMHGTRNPSDWRRVAIRWSLRHPCVEQRRCCDLG